MNFRGKAITIGGPKQVDPRLASQEKTGKTSNQSHKMYTPAVAGNVDEGYMLYNDLLSRNGSCILRDRDARYKTYVINNSLWNVSRMMFNNLLLFISSV